ncbi:polysaccharide deacetylase family protein [Peterkaempfera bronchialis]|uniref:Polysaccharide deacetylase n=1 Tax=Peterkaempfera bronchialis TaxID=2126346 RepID=A0A345T2P4_9ACTN|nr:polysaccharide deacetylase family protein [Peterkaempfera bronchialis]AXI80249.1 polysaccharide deacetylase [Peterkaempfera bronchialis]
MRIAPHLSIRGLVTGLAVAAMAMAGTVSLGVNATPSHAATCNGYVGLTFDDGPSNDHTPAILNALKQNGLRATMFNEGQYAASYPAQVQAEINAGMWVGNHSYTHPHLTQQSQAQIDSEISRTQQAISSAGGGTPKLFRPPYGETNSTLKSVEAKYGLTEIIWDVDSQDWNGASVDAIVQANAQLGNGQVILMHEWPANTLTAIPRIAQGLASRGLCAGMISPQTGRAVAPDGGGTTTGGTTTGGTTTGGTTTGGSTTGGATTGGTTTGGSTTGGGGTPGGCKVAYNPNSWPGGFTADVTITNTGSSAINGWNLGFTLPSGQSVANAWNANISPSSGAVTASNVSFNGQIPANGGTASFGFQGTWSGSSFSKPASFTLNGTACSMA